MLQITPQHHLWFALDVTDFRKGIDGLVALCRQKLNADPFSGHLFVFRNRSGSSIKLLIYDGNGFWLCQKRFSSGHLKWWPQTQEQAEALHSVELLVMLQQGNPLVTKVPAHWRRLS